MMGVKELLRSGDPAKHASSADSIPSWGRDVKRCDHCLVGIWEVYRSNTSEMHAQRWVCCVWCMVTHLWQKTATADMQVR